MNFQIAKLFGVPVRLNWTFILLLWAIFAYVISIGGSVVIASLVVGAGILLFSCVLVHEFAHVLTARRYGIDTESVTMYFIGGMARLERIPRGTWEEFWIAIAGPISNVVMAMIGIALGLLFGETLKIDFDPIGSPFQAFALFNLAIAGFNLLPAFPMDGGRILRSLFALKTDYLLATKYASIIGRLFGIAFVVIGVLNIMITLIFIGLFVYLAAQAEYELVKREDAESKESGSEPVV